jgi:hypothetical protein
MPDRPPMVSRLSVAVNRFTPTPTFRAATMPDAPIRVTRFEAIADELAWQEGNRHG